MRGQTAATAQRERWCTKAIASMASRTLFGASTHHGGNASFATADIRSGSGIAFKRPSRTFPVSWDRFVRPPSLQSVILLHCLLPGVGFDPPDGVRVVFVL